jgi:regulator of sigma E protease
MILYLYIFLGIAALGVLVFVHELGHFLAGKAFNVKVNEFMLGLPSLKLAKVQRGETTYGVTMLPFGGYVKFAGMDPTEELSPEDEKRSFDAQSFGKRLLILAAGPTCNMLLAAVLFAGVFMYGLPAPTTTIQTVLKGYPAQKIGLQRGDEVLSIEGKKVRSWQEMIGVLHASAGKRITITVRRDGEVLTFRPTLVRRKGKGFLGIGPSFVDKGFGFFQSIWLGIKAAGLMVVSIAGFLLELPRQAELLQQARGPVGIVQERVKAARNGFRDFVWLMGVFSVSLGVFNLIPIPPLDGGKVALAGVEGLLRRRIPKNSVIAISAVGASLLVVLMIYIVVADIGRLLPGGAGG